MAHSDGRKPEKPLGDGNPSDTLSEEIFAWVVVDDSPMTPEAAEGGHVAPDDVEAAQVARGAGRQLVLSAPAVARALGYDVPEATTDAGISGAVSSEAIGAGNGLSPLPQSSSHSLRDTVMANLTSGPATHILPLLGGGSNSGAAVFPVASQNHTGGSGGHLIAAGHDNGPAVAGLIPNGTEGKPLAIHLTAVDGHNSSKGLALTIGGLPAGTTLNHGHPGPGGVWVLNPGTDLGNLVMTPPKDWSGNGSLTLTAVQPNGQMAQAQVPFQVKSTPDPAIISGTDSGTTVEDRVTSASGQLNVIDPDPGQDHFAASKLFGQFGNLTTDQSGHWTYELSNNSAPVQALLGGAMVRDVFKVHSIDGTAHQIVVNVLGTDDKAVISGTGVGTVTEDSLQSAGGKLDAIDPDAGQASFVPQPLAAGAHGVLTVQPDGIWSYALNNGQPVVQALKSGDQLTDTVTVRTVDGTSHQIQITIHGTNDAPVLSAATASATEDGSAVSGQMSATDVDSGDTQAYSLGQAAPAGFALTGDGSWSFDPTDAAYQHLAAGATEQVRIPVTVTDSAGGSDTKTLVITVTGSNDGPVVSGPVSLPGGTEDT
ncbi:VCBS domain-containing protein, partial [Sedimentitalea todarodis]